MQAVRNPQVRKLLDLVSPRVGVVRKLERVPRGVDEPNPPVLYRALLSNFDFKKVEIEERATAGKGMTEEEAMASAIGEALERYCAYHPPFESIRRAPLAELDTPSITPAECVLFSANQYARKHVIYPRWTAERSIGWQRARELPGGGDVYIPAFLTYLNYYGPAGEDNFCTSTSNGLAAGPDLPSAVLSGLCELAERDGFLVYWMNRLPAPEVEFEGGIAAEIRDHYRAFGAVTHVFNVTTNLPMYSMLAILLSDDPRSPSALVGLGCSLDPRVAMNRALFEICQMRPGEAARFAREDPSALRAYSDIKTMRDHSAFFMCPEHRAELAFLLESGRRQQLKNLPSHTSGNLETDVGTAVNGLVRAGLRVAYADITTEDIEPFGVRVVRTIATGLQPIHFGCGEERLGGQRLFEMPRLLNYAAAATTEADLNPCPHPLA
jgi:ribosomal protein S12 methylthiotransferase accessory factor